MIKKILASSLLALLSSHSALADTWYVNVDTAALAGQSGWLDLQFNPADAFAPAASVTIMSFNSTGLMQPDANLLRRRGRQSGQHAHAG